MFKVFVKYPSFEEERQIADPDDEPGDGGD